VITAFYMFRLWYLAFAGQPRDEHRYDHAHESPPEMYGTLVLLAVFAIGVAWTPKEAVGGAMAAAAIFLLVFYMLRANWTRATAIPFLLCAAVLIWGMLWQTAGLEQATLRDVLEQARPPGTAQVGPGRLVPLNWPDEHATHELAIRGPVSWTAFLSAIAGILLATIFYCWKWLSAEDVAAHFRPVYRFLLNKWWFDELYDWLFVQPTLLMARAVAAIDRRWIDGFIDGSARAVRQISATWDTVFDRAIVDGLANKLAAWTYGLGLAFRRIQTGSLRQYVLFIVVAMVAVFVLVSFFWGFASAS
jgi:NADH-quinone oxidoreductase subunit L